MPLRINLTATAGVADDNGIATSQTKDAAGALTLTGTTVTVGSGNQMVTITSTADLSGVTFTVTGYMPNSGALSSVTVTGPNNATVEVDYFQTVTEVTVSGSIDPETVIVGWTNKAVSNPWIADVMQDPFAVGFGCVITDGTPAFSVQHTFDTVLSKDTDPADWNWFTNSSVSAETANTDGNYAYPVSAIRLYVNGTGTVTLKGYQAMGK